MGSCWIREDMSLKGSCASCSTDEDDEGDVTSSKESDSNDDPREVEDTEEDEEAEKEPTISYSWTGPSFLWASTMVLLLSCCSIDL